MFGFISLLWRSVWLPRVLFVVALVAGLPLFLRSPLWCDLTLYDMAVRNLLRGGVHYRDIFDTNLPGFVWLLTGLRWAFGPSAVVVRVADLLVVAGILVLIDRLAKWGGATPASRWWALAGAAFLYPFSVEMVHGQRDVWMALPALAAVALRVRRVVRPRAEPYHGTGFWCSALEGVLWGMAVWIKPHVVLMAGAVWVLTARRVAGCYARPGRALAADLVGNLLGGAAVGAAGVFWLIKSGTWEHFLDVMRRWNPEYTQLAVREFPLRVRQQLHWFPPWSLFLLPTVPLAILSLIDARSTGSEPGPVGRWLPGWLWDGGAGPEARFTRGVLAGLYLVWAFQAFFIQRGFMYAHMPETLLMLGLWAAHRWALPALVLLWIAATSVVWLAADANPVFRDRLLTVATDRHISADPGEERYVVRHPLANPRRMACWPDCWRLDLTPRQRYALWDRLRRITEHEAVIGWEELNEVAKFLRQKGVGDHELIAWHDTPHVLYLMLDIEPGLRYMHTCTVLAIGEGRSNFGYHEMTAAMGRAMPKARFAVGDLEWVALTEPREERPLILGPPRNPSDLPGNPRDLLPAALDAHARGTFPFYYPAVFRSGGGLGRYTVHDLKQPPIRPATQPPPSQEQSPAGRGP
jgi:hypothetical protein